MTGLFSRPQMGMGLVSSRRMNPCTTYRVQFGAQGDKPEDKSTSKGVKTKPQQKKGMSFWGKMKALVVATIGLSMFTGASYMYSYTAIGMRAERMALWSNAKFRFFGADGKEQLLNFNLTQVKHQIAFRLNEVLQDRPDLRDALYSLPNGIEIRLYDSAALKEDGEMHTVGLAQIEPHGGLFGTGGPTVSMSFATKFVEGNLELDSVGNDVVAHELTHVLDFIDPVGKEQFQLVGADGFLPGWSKSQKAKFIAARTAELEKIKGGFSPMDKYALTNDKEFLAVLTEAFFEKPQELKASNPTLYSMMANFFDLDPASSMPWATTKGFVTGDLSVDYMGKRQPGNKYYIWGGYGLVLTAGGLYMLVRKKRAGGETREQMEARLLKEFLAGDLTSKEYAAESLKLPPASSKKK